MVAIKTEITVTYTPILNLSAVGRDLAAPYMVYGAEAKIQDVGRPGERIILIFEEDGFIIDFNWLRIAFLGQGSREGYDNENGPLRFFFELVAKIESLPGFGKIKELKLDTWDVIEVSEGALADPAPFKEKYLSTRSFSTKGDFEDLSLNLVYKSPSRSWSWVFGPYKKKADWDKHDLLVFTQRNIDDLININGILSRVVITDVGSKANHKLYLSMYKEAKDILSGIV